MKTLAFALSAVAALLVSIPLCAVADDETNKPIVLELKDFKLPTEKADLFNYSEGEQKLSLYTNGKVESKFKVPAAGDYEIVIRATGDAAMNEGAKFRLAIDDKAVGKETEVTADESKEYKFTSTLKPGEHTLAIEFTNDVYKEGEYDRNLYLRAASLKKVK
jgi:hypothetical protein